MIKFVDMFSGIGGFREGLTRAGGFECVGHCEIDKYANRSYNALFDTKGEWFIEDARKADPSTMPDFQLLCGGFPCQSFSVAGARRGFSDPRGTLFFEIARLVEARHPAYLILENVPGLLSHSRGETYATVLNTLDRLGYGVEWLGCNGTGTIQFGCFQNGNGNTVEPLFHNKDGKGGNGTGQDDAPNCIHESQPIQNQIIRHHENLKRK